MKDYRSCWLVKKDDNKVKIYLIDYKKVDDNMFYFIYNHNYPNVMEDQFIFFREENLLKKFKIYEKNTEFLSRHIQIAISSLFEDHELTKFVKIFLKWRNL